MDGQHETERQHECEAGHHDQRPVGKQQLDRTDIAIGSGDNLARLSAVVVRKRQRGQMVIQQCP